MPVTIDPRKADALKAVFNLSDYSIRRIFRDFPEIAESPDLVPKLEYLAENYPRKDWRHKSCASLAACGFWWLTYDELLLCASVPDRMGFTEEERERHNRMVLKWDNPYDFRPLIPLLAMLCGPENAGALAKELCWPGFFTSDVKARAIAERLLSYPGKISRWWGDCNLRKLLSRFADPLRAFGELEARFSRKHLREIVESRDDWGWIGYDLGPGMPDTRAPDPRYAKDVLKETELIFAAYRL